MKKELIFGTVAGAMSILAFASPSRADDAERSTPTTETETVTTQTTAAPVPVTPTPSATSTTTTTSADTEAAMRASTMTPPADTITLYRERRPNKNLLIPGASLLAGTYAATAIVNYAGPSRDDNLYIPVVGPWMNLADRNCDTCDNETRNKILIAGSGVLQGAGALLTLGSFIFPEKVETARIEAGPVKINFTPTTARGGAGIGAVGTF